MPEAGFLLRRRGWQIDSAVIDFTQFILCRFLGLQRLRACACSVYIDLGSTFRGWPVLEHISSPGATEGVAYGHDCSGTTTRGGWRVGEVVRKVWMRVFVRLCIGRENVSRRRGDVAKRPMVDVTSVMTWGLVLARADDH